MFHMRLEQLARHLLDIKFNQTRNKQRQPITRKNTETGPTNRDYSIRIIGPQFPGCYIQMVSFFYDSCRNTEQNRDRLSFTCINTSIWRTKQACLSYLRQEPVSEVILSRRCNLHTTLETILASLEYAFDKGQDNFMINRQCMQLLTMMLIDSRCLKLDKTDV